MSNPLQLVFRQPPLSNPADLVFGEVGSEAGDVLLTLAAEFPAPEVSLSVVPAVEVTIAADFAAPAVYVAVNYNVNVERPTVSQTVSRASTAQTLQASVTNHEQAPVPTFGSAASGHASAVRVDCAAVDGSRSLARLRSTTSERHSRAVRLGAQIAAAHAEMLRDRRLPVRSGHQNAAGAATSARTRSQDRYRDRRLGVASGHRSASSLHLAGLWAHNVAARSQAWFQVRTQEAIVPPPGISAIVPPEPDVCYLPSPRLVFRLAPGSPTLVFRCDEHDNPPNPGTIIVPIRRTYMVLNEVTLRRVTGDIELSASNIAISLDHKSWTFDFSASLPASAMQYLDPESDGSPALLEATINGVTFLALAESKARSRTFGRDGFSVRGRGKAALLDSPYAPVKQFTSASARTAQQLMEYALTVSGVSLGWDVDFGLTDWLVPANTWAIEGSFIGALNDIAGAAGGYLQPHLTDDAIRVLPLYPTAPWDWGGVSPDFLLPSSIVQQEGIDWVNKAAYNAVVVAGATGGGVRGNIKRAGSAGDLAAPMVTHPLLTHVDAARQRGIAILGDTGAQANVKLRLPVLASTGIILPGKFVSYVDGSTTRFGITRAVDVQAAGSQVWQSITVETRA